MSTPQGSFHPEGSTLHSGRTEGSALAEEGCGEACYVGSRLEVSTGESVCTRMRVYRSRGWARGEGKEVRSLGSRIENKDVLRSH